MFKIESYIAPLLMGYVDQYVKLKQEDFQLSLWGGDAVLNKLDLRLDAIERMLHLPICIKSGHIHELRIHVPWTKLGSEPVVITINTIECILKLRNAAYDDRASSSSKSSSSTKTSSQSTRPRVKKQETEDLPPGYLQSLVNRIINNVNIVINNLILKFVEDDIVLSVNVKSAECYSVGPDWMRSFVELTQPELVLRRILDIHDLTVCLDKRNASGKIETYQDPLLYRCSVTCRLHLCYDSLHAILPCTTKFNVFCEKLDLSLTDTQLPMFFRLVELLVALYYGTLEFPSLPANPARAEVIHRSEVDHEAAAGKPEDEATDVDGAEVREDDQGWVSWAWSYVPQILPPDEQEENQPEEDRPKRKAEPVVLVVGFYVNKASIVFKLTETTLESSYYGPQKIVFKPCMNLEAEGVSCEVLLRGLIFFNVQFGISRIHVNGQGESIGGLRDLEGVSRNACFLSAGLPGHNQKPINYTTGSLFDPGGAENRGEQAQYIFDGEKHAEKHTEAYVVQKFGSFWLDYLYLMEQAADDSHGSSHSSKMSQEEDSAREVSTTRFVVGPGDMTVSSSMVQRVHKFIHCATDHDYDPYSKPRPEIVDETRLPPTEAQVRVMEQFIPTRSYHVTLLNSSIIVHAAELPKCDITRKRVTKHRKSRKSEKMRKAGDDKVTPVFLPALVLRGDRVDFQQTMPMYPRKMVKLVSKMATPSDNLLHHCHSHTYFKVFGVECGLTYIDPGGKVPALKNILQPFSGAYYRKRLLLSVYWKNRLQPKTESMYELPHLAGNLTKAQTMLLGHMAFSWTQATPSPAKLLDISLIDDIFSPAHSQQKQPVLELSMSGLEMKDCRTQATMSICGSISGVQVVLFSYDHGKDHITPLVYGPLDTSRVHQVQFFKDTNQAVDQVHNECITFTVQTPNNTDAPGAPAVVLLTLEGVVGCLDPMLQDWMSYVPVVKKPQPKPQLQVMLDPALAESSSPLRNRATSAESSGSPSVPTESQTRSQSHTRSATQTVTKVPAEEMALGSEIDSSVGGRLAKLFPLIKILQVQIDIQSCVSFVPTKHVSLPEPTMNIPLNLREVYTRGELCDTLVICCPTLRLYSAGHKWLSPLQEIPIKALENSVAGEKLPWSVQVNKCSVYTVHKSGALYYLVKPASLSATIAVSPKYASPTSDTVTALGLCVHADMDTVSLAISKIQTQLLYDLVMYQVEAVQQMLRGFKVYTSTQITTDSPEDSPSGTMKTAFSPPAKVSIQPGSSSSLIEPVDMVGTVTETSESMSRDFSPSHELEDGLGVKLSLWVQWTLPRLLVRIFSEDDQNQALCVSATAEDLTASIDVQRVYSKIKCKIGAVNINHYVRSAGQKDWYQGRYEGLLLSSTERLNTNVHVASNKFWGSQGLPIVSLFNVQDLKPPDKSHGFLSVTLTRALSKNVKKKLKKIGMDAAENLVSNLRGSEATGDRVYLNEICVNIQPCDVVLSCPVIVDALKVVAIKIQRSEETRQTPRLQQSVSQVKKILPWISSSYLPLVYMNASNLRLFVPNLESINPDTDLGKPPLLGHDMCVFQLSSLALVPQADNPLPRIVVEKEVYRKAVHAGTVSHPGSEVEDRQYQLDISGLSLTTGSWQDLVLDGAGAATLQDEENLAAQNPALEWNNLIQQQSEVKEAKLVPVANGFDLRVVVAPPIVCTPPVGDTAKQEPVLVCGLSLEANATTDMDFYLSVSQVRLLHLILTSNAFSLLNIPTVIANQQPRQARKPRPPSLSDSTLYGRGISTIDEKVELSSSAQSDWFNVMPFDVLLTAGKVSFMAYDHQKRSKLAKASAKREEGVKKARGKSDLEWKSMESVLAPQSGITASPSQSSLSSVTQTTESGIVADQSMDSKFEDKGICQEEVVQVKPFLFAYFSQPHTVMSCQPSGQKVELSCYDVVLKGATPGHTVTDEFKCIPEPGDFSVHWLETRPGRTDPKTGIPPSLYTLRVKDFLQQPAKVQLRIERPVKANLSLPRLQQLLDFIEQLVPGLLGKQGDQYDKSTNTPPASKHHKKEPAYMRMLAKVDNVRMVMVQLMVGMEVSDTEERAAVLGSISAFSGQVDFRPNEQGAIEEIESNICVEDISVKTAYQGKWRPLVGPFTLSANMAAQWCKHSGPAHVPKVTLLLDSDLLPLFVGQEHAMCFLMINHHLQDFIKSSKLIKMIKESVSSTKSEDSTSKAAHPHDDDRDAEEISHSFDDLRVGQFDYITEDEAEVLPNPQEIVFCTDLEEGRAYMSWSYPEARVVTRLHVTPVPFNLPQEVDIQFIDESLRAPCVLQYWDVLKRCYLDVASFSLSQNDNTDVVIVDITSGFGTDHVVAQTWRVVVLPPAGRNGGSQHGDEEEGSLEPLVLPDTLAASMRVDSSFIQRLVPAVQVSASASRVQVALATHLQHLAKGTNERLKPFCLGQRESVDQEYLTLRLDRPVATSGCLLGKHKTIQLQGSTIASCDVLEYRNLTMQPVLEPSDGKIKVTLKQDGVKRTVQCKAEADPLVLKVGQSSIHTLYTAVQAWNQLNEKEGSQVLMPYFLLCNDTQDMLRFGQVGTDEGILLQPREAQTYSWRTHKAKQLLRLCVEGLGWRWTDPIDLHENATSVHRIDHKGRTATLLVTVQQLTNVQKQVIISGQVVIASRLTQHLEVKLLTSRQVKDTVQALGAKQTLPSYVVELEDIKALRVRFMGVKMPWSQDITIAGDKMRENRLVKIPLHDKSNYIHVWCRIFTEYHQKAAQYLVMFTPLFIVRSHLPNTVWMNLDTPRLKTMQQVELEGHGHEHQLNLIGGDMTHNATFQLGSTVPVSSPPIALSSGMIEQVDQLPVDKPLISALAYNWDEDLSQTWPYNQPDSGKKSEAQVAPPSQQQLSLSKPPAAIAAEAKRSEQPNIDLQIQLRQCWPGCNTLLVEVAPCWLLVNEAGLDLVLVDAEGSQWQLMRDHTFAPPKLQGDIQLGIMKVGHLHLSDPLTVSEEEFQLRLPPEGSTNVLYREGQTEVRIHLRTKICYLTVHSSVQHDIRVCTIRERFTFVNNTPIPLEAECHCIPLNVQGGKVPLDYQFADVLALPSAQDSSADTESTCALYWNIPAAADQSQPAKPVTAEYVQYVSFRLKKEHSVMQDSGRVEACLWSYPVRPRLKHHPTRITLSVPVPSEQGQGHQTEALVLSAHTQDLVTYLSLDMDNGPGMVLHNNCDFPLCYGQTLLEATERNVSVQEDAELISTIPELPAKSSTHWTFAYVNSNFPSLRPQQTQPKLHLSRQVVADELGDNRGEGAPRHVWSVGVDVHSGYSSFVNIPELSDVKVYVELVGHTRHVYIDPVSRAEISAKEVRSRIRGKETTVIIENSGSPTSPGVPSTPGSPSGPAFSQSKETSPEKEEGSRSAADLSPKSEPDESVKYPVEIELVASCQHFSFALVDDATFADRSLEMLRITADRSFIGCYPVETLDLLTLKRPRTTQRVAFVVGDIQVDNQMYSSGSYDFPVVFLGQESMAKVNIDADFQSKTLVEQLEILQAASLLAVEGMLTTDVQTSKTVLRTVHIAFKPVTLYLEDCFAYDTFEKLDTFFPIDLARASRSSKKRRKVPYAIKMAARGQSSPITLEELVVEPIALQLSLHFTLKVFVSSDNTPLSFKKLERKNLCTISRFLTHDLAMHYAAGALFRAGWVVGSLELLGNPTGLIRNIGTGVADLFRIPYAGLTKGPGAFLSGVTQGTSSLLRHISTGALTSITNFASSVSRNMDRFSLDMDHLERQEHSRRQRPEGLSDGLKQGLSGFGLSLLGAIAGIADQPIQSIQRVTDSNRPISPSQKATGIVSGIGKGLVGAVTKPIGGTAELLSQTSQGLLQGTGLTKFPMPRYPAVLQPIYTARNSSIKFAWKMLQTVPGAEVLLAMPAIQAGVASQVADVTLVLAPEILFIVSSLEDAQQQAFAVSEIECKAAAWDDKVLVLSLREPVGRKDTEHDGSQVKNKERVAAFIDGASAAYVNKDGVTDSQSEVLSQGSMAAGASGYQFEVDPVCRTYFITMFSRAKQRVTGVGFPT